MDLTKKESVAEFGEFKKNGKQFYLQQAPYLSGACDADPIYTAWAVDSRGKICFLVWRAICDESGQMIDTGCESDACDWTDFKVRY